MGLEASDDPNFGEPTHGEKMRELHRNRAIHGLTALILTARGASNPEIRESIRVEVESVIDNIIYSMDPT